MTTLVLSSRHTEDDQALWRSAVQRGWSVERARGVIVPAINDPEIVIYVEALFAPIIAQKLGRRLHDPPESWLVELPMEFKQRKIEICSLGDARKLTRRSFVKPPNDKSFKSKVYDDGGTLPTEFDDNMWVLVAEPVSWLNEFRCFCLDGKVKTLSPYLRTGVHAEHTEYAASDQEIAEATNFAELVLADRRVKTPRAIVLDVGQIVDKGWAIVEANGAWGSGIYGCNPDSVLDVIRHAIGLVE